MTLIDADLFLQYLIFSKHIDNLTCGEVKEAVEMSKVDVFGKIRVEIANLDNLNPTYLSDGRYTVDKFKVLEIIDKHKAENTE